MDSSDVPFEPFVISSVEEQRMHDHEESWASLCHLVVSRLFVPASLLGDSDVCTITGYGLPAKETPCNI